MKKFIWMAIILVIAIFLFGNRDSLLKRISSEEIIRLEMQPTKSYRLIENKLHIQGCIALTETKEDKEDIDEQEQIPASQPPEKEENSPSEGGSSGKPAKSCKQVYVIDQPEQKEEGHYETVHHEAVTKVERSYKEYLEYIFYRDDGSSYIYKDYEKSFLADSYLASHPEFCRYTFSKKYDEIKTTVIVQPAYDEQVWIIDKPYQKEKGHYKEVCE